MFFVFTYFLVEIYVGFRILAKLKSEKLIEHRDFLKVFGMFLATVVVCVGFLAVVFPQNWTALWAFFSFLSLVLLSTNRIIRFVRRKKFSSSFGEFLDRTILLIQAGKPFRAALHQAVEESDAFTQQRMQRLLDFVFFSQQNMVGESDSFVNEVIEELVLGDRFPHRSLQRLETWRKNLKLESEFRRKSEQVLTRIRLQSYMLGGLYIALLIFDVVVFGWQESHGVVLPSAILFTAGLSWIAFDGRKMRWKV